LRTATAVLAHGTARDCMVIFIMSARSARQPQTDVLITHPNREKPVVQATRATVILLLLASALLMLVITFGGFKVLDGLGPIVMQFILVFLYLLMAFFAVRWSRGVLPVAAAIAVLLATFALVAAPSWFARDKAGIAQPALNSSLLGLLTLLLIPVQILLVAFAMRGFSQGWNVEREVRDSPPGVGDYRGAAPNPA
jgi:hypothetical protein